MKRLVTSETLVLLNKQDLVNTKLGSDSVDGVENSWHASLATGVGMLEFVEGLGKVLKQRQV